jgi:hypothetical protein|nr:MAG TPA: protein of unknown function (DUF5351) [Caudoviricetes sp.]
MTTNNHPANGPVSLERLHQISEILSKAAAQSDGGNIGYAMADAVKVIDGAISEFGVEPVAWTSTNALDDVFCGKTSMIGPNGVVGGIPLYTAPPAPVSPDKMTVEMTYPRVQTNWHDAKNFAEGWNACRADMLQNAEPVTKHYKLPPHVYRELVNSLRDTAVKYHGCQQLREQISETLSSVITHTPHCGNSTVTPEGNTCKYCGGTGYFRWQKSAETLPCPCVGCDLPATGVK